MGLLAYLEKRKTRKHLRQMSKLDREPERLRLKYPHYTFGVGTYGSPEVTDFDSDSVLKVGAYTSIAEDVKILLGGEHRTNWITTYPFPAMVPEVSDILDYSPSKGDVVIGSDCWICTNAVILSGVTIGHGAIVGAGAMVCRDVAPYSVVGGSPAKFIRWRFEEEIRQTLLEAAWWDWPVEEVKTVARTLCSQDIESFLDYIKARKAPADKARV